MKQQLDWLELQLSSAEPNRKFVIFLHIYPGQYQVGTEMYFWEEDSTHRFTKVMEMYSDKVAIILGAHTHYSDVRVNMPLSTEAPPLVLNDKELSNSSHTNKTQEEEVKTKLEKVHKETHSKYQTPKLALLVTPAVSPAFLNNPGYTIFEIQDGIAKNIKFHFLELYEFPQSTEGAKFNVLDFKVDLGIDEFTPAKVYKFLTSLEGNMISLFKYLAKKIGYKDNMQTLGLEQYLRLQAKEYFSKSIYFCSVKHVHKVDFKHCLNSY
jgi:hypothetical protein